MIGYLVRRVGQSILVVILVALIVFVLLHLLPGGPARASLGTRATPLQIRQFNHANGLDKPLVVQFGIWGKHLLEGNLGYSYKLNQSVAALLGERLPKTLVLTGLSTALAVIVAVPMGMYQAIRRNTLGDYALTGLAFVMYATPTYFLGIVLILVFSDSMHVFPPSPTGENLATILSHPKGLVLPVATLALITLALFSRYMRSSVLDNVAEDYVRTARAKGAGETRILFRHIMRNALIPVVTLLGLQLPQIFSGALITESVFNYPGLGFLFWQSAQTDDFPVLLGFILVVSVATVVGSLLADIAYAALDPRVRYVNS